MKRMKQIRESRRLISEAFMLLLQTEPLAEITISQIAAEAAIARNTFYNHFQNKEEVLLYMMESWLEDIKERIQSTQANTLRDVLLWRFTLLRENPYLGAFAREQEIQTMLRHFREQNISSIFQQDGMDEYTRAFFQGGLDSATGRWIAGGMKESPEEMVERLLGFVRIWSREDSNN